MVTFPQLAQPDEKSELTTTTGVTLGRRHQRRRAEPPGKIARRGPGRGTLGVL